MNFDRLFELMEQSPRVQNTRDLRIGDTLLINDDTQECSMFGGPVIEIGEHHFVIRLEEEDGTQTSEQRVDRSLEPDGTSYWSIDEGGEYEVRSTTPEILAEITELIS